MRIRRGMPTSWVPDPNYRKPADQYENSISQRRPITGSNNFSPQHVIETHFVNGPKGMRKVLINKTTGDVIVFGVENGKEILIK